MFEEQQVPMRTRQTYQSALNRFLRWCELQSWWVPPPTSQRTLNFSKPNSDTASLHHQQAKLTRKHRYGLGSVAGDVVPERLLKQLEEFQAFRSERSGAKQSTVDRNLRQVRLILGWLHRIKGISLDELSLETIVPFVDLGVPSQIELAEKVAFETRDLAKQYIGWLQSTSAHGDSQESATQRNAHSSIDILGIFLVIAQFIYRDRLPAQNPLVIGKPYQDVPVIQLLRKELAEVQSQVKQQRSFNDCSNTVPEWSEVLRFVEKLRQGCAIDQIPSRPAKQRRTKSANARVLEDLAQSYQRFLLAAFLSYLPPQRQQVYRNLCASTSDKIIEKINNVSLGESGYLYLRQNQWYLHLHDDEYKTSKTYHEISLVLPNIQYKDGRCFYQYLEEWLFKYKYSTFNSTETINGLRQVFSPNHDYFFTQRNGSRYSHATNFSRLLHSSAGDSNTEFTPELIRRAFAAYVSRQGHIVQKVKALSEQKGQLQLPNSRDELYDLWRDQETIQLGTELACHEVESFVWHSSPVHLED
ncbi:hypothetical protein IFO70_27740 [Phormidium tenue FACHB-886]|nr:hypothetical protein [Phormidium tenue FACHB-886]